MKTIEEITVWMRENGYMMLNSLEGYWYCVHANEGDSVEEWQDVWMDSACEDAYDYDKAMAIAYDAIQDMTLCFDFNWCDSDDNVLKSKVYSFHDLDEARKHALLLLGEDNSGTDHISIDCRFYNIYNDIVRYGE